MSEEDFIIKFKEGVFDCKKCNNTLDDPYTCKFCKNNICKECIESPCFFVKMEMIKKMIFKKIFNYTELLKLFQFNANIAKKN